MKTSWLKRSGVKPAETRVLPAISGGRQWLIDGRQAHSMAGKNKSMAGSARPWPTVHQEKDAERTKSWSKNVAERIQGLESSNL